MNTDLTGKRALVCGSSQGIGRGAAIQLASLGADVTLLARSADALEQVAAELPRSATQRHDCIAADFDDLDAAIESIRSRMDPARPWLILVHNTGGPRGGRAIDADPAEFLVAFQRHLIAGQRLVQLLVPAMKAARYGRIINVISTSVKAPIPGLGVSNTIRGAVASWAKTLAGELAADGITVNNVLPGFTDTARLAELFKAKAARLGASVDDVRADAIAGIPAARLGEPEEIGAGVAFLATPAAAYINGINLPIDGGRTPSL
jgi:3-oxoacyl-[acyl-carrier protein] reductase